MLTDEQLLQYSRQIMLPQIDIAGQQKLLDAHLLIIGVGGLGSPVALYLAAAGIGKITIVDDDRVDGSNLQRQVIHQQKSIGQTKVDSAKNSMLAINPDCNIKTIDCRLSENEFNELLKDISVVVDCSDNFATRFLINRCCFKQKTPLVSAAAIRWEGQLTTFLMDGNSPCYRCLYDEESAVNQSCSSNGIVGPVVGVMGSLQALEAIKCITGVGQLAIGELTLFDGLDLSFRKIKYQKKLDCPVCSH